METIDLSKVSFIKVLVLVFVCMIVGFAGLCWGQVAIEPEGDGTDTNPHVITSLENLYWMTKFSYRWSLNYIQDNDIGASETEGWNNGEGWIPIGDDSNSFTGNYDGQGYEITGLFIKRPLEDYQGFLGKAQGASVKNVNLIDANIKGNNRTGILIGHCSSSDVIHCFVSGVISGRNRVGALIGYTSGNTSIADSQTFCSVNGEQDVGGLVGYSHETSITNSCSYCFVYGEIKVGGLVGSNYFNSKIINSYSNSNVSGYGLGITYIGGIAGDNRSSDILESYSIGIIKSNGNAVGGIVGFNNSDGLVEDCFSTSHVIGDNNVGGIVGHNLNEIKNSYSAGYVEGTGNDIGGLVGSAHSQARVEDSYWDTETSGQSNSAGGDGKSTREMILRRTFDPGNNNDGWNFREIDGIWSINDEETYPFLRWQGEAADHNVPAVRRKMEREGDDYRIDFTGWGADPASVRLINVDETEIEATYTIYSSHPSVQLFPVPEHLGAYYRFEVEDASVFREGDDLRLTFQQKPNQLWFRDGSGGWTAMSEGGSADWYWDEDNNQAVVTNLEFGITRSGGIFEYAGDTGAEGETLPVELSSFTAAVTADIAVQLSWTAETESNMLGYNVFRSRNDNLSEAERLNLVIIPAHNRSVMTNYSFLDENVDPGSYYYYWLQANELDLSSEFHGPVSIMVDDKEDGGSGIAFPILTELQGNYPNPFNPGTWIKFSIEEPEVVSITIYNNRGQQVRSLVDKKDFAKGRSHKVYWDGRDDDGNGVCSGVYLYEMETESGFRSIKKMILMK